MATNQADTTVVDNDDQSQDVSAEASAIVIPSFERELTEAQFSGSDDAVREVQERYDAARVAQVNGIGNNPDDSDVANGPTHGDFDALKVRVDELEAKVKELDK